MREKGFTLIEMTIVMVVLGILGMGFADSLVNKFANTMEEKDRISLEEAKRAIISYALSNGGIPDPVTVGAITNTMPDIAAFGVNNWGAFGDNTNNPFRMDVNTQLSSTSVTTAAGITVAATGGDKVVFCQAVNQQMLSATLPATCQDFNSRDAAACSIATPKAFVLYSAGNNRSSDQENDEASTVGTMTNNRFYENDSRGINNSPGTDKYDDQMMSYPLSALASDCRNSMGVLSTVMACTPGQKYVKSVTNNTAAAVSYTLNAVVKTVPASFTSYENTCFPRTATFQAGAGPASALSTLDANNDGLLDVLITAATTFSAQ